MDVGLERLYIQGNLIQAYMNQIRFNLLLSEGLYTVYNWTHLQEIDSNIQVIK